MSKDLQTKKEPETIKTLLAMDGTKNKLTELIGAKKVAAFSSAVVQITQNNTLLAKASPRTILNAAVTAAILDLPINQNLGFAWIVPYKGSAQFQIGARGFIQLAQRSGQYKKLNVVPVYQNQFESFNSATEEFKGNMTKEGEGKVVGYLGYFQLLSGFEKTVYWTVATVQKHAKRYSKGYGNDTSVWKSNFDEMAMKTVAKHMIKNWGPMTVDQANAIASDQSVQDEFGHHLYPDNEDDFSAYEDLDTEKPAETINPDFSPEGAELI
jgi:recombination protein RecT